MCYTVLKGKEGDCSAMVKRELYMSRIRPFIGTDLIKVMTGIRRCGKSVMLELIKQELTESGIDPAQFMPICRPPRLCMTRYPRERPGSAARCICFSTRSRR